MGAIISLLNIIDLFPQKINFTYNQRQNFPTVCGGFFTILTLLLIFAYVYIVMKISYSKAFPTISRHIEKYDLAPSITIHSDPNMKYYNGSEFLYDDSTEFNDTSVLNNALLINADQTIKNKYLPPFRFEYPDIPEEIANYTFFQQLAFGFAYKSETVDLDPSMIDLKVIQYSSNISLSSFKYYNKCKRFHKFPKDLIVNSKIANIYCIYDTFILSGNEENQDYEYVQFKFMRCNNTISRCKSNGEISDYLNNLKVFFVYSKYIFDEISIENPVTIHLNVKCYTILSTLVQRSNFYTFPDKLLSYDSYLPEFLDKSVANYYGLIDQSYYQQLETYTRDELSFLRIYLRASLERNLITRKYSDILEILGVVGGMSRIVSLIITFILAYYTQFRVRESMVNNFYSLIDPKNNKFLNRTFAEFLLCKFYQFGLLNNAQIININNKYYDDYPNNGLNLYFNKNKIIYIFGLLLNITEKSYGNVFENINFDFEDIMFSDNTDVKIKDMAFERCVVEIKKFEIIYNVTKPFSYEKMYFSFSEFLAYLLLPDFLKTKMFRIKTDIFKKASVQLKKDTDFLNIIKSIKELGILRTVFFTDGQLKLFKFVSNKPITVDDLKKIKMFSEKTISKTKQEEIDQFNENIRLEELQEYQAAEEYNPDWDDDILLKGEEDCKATKELENSLKIIIINGSINTVDKALIKNLKINFTEFSELIYSKKFSAKKNLTDFTNIFGMIVSKCKINDKGILKKKKLSENSSFHFEFNDEDNMKALEMKIIELNATSEKRDEINEYERVSKVNQDDLILNINNREEVLEKVAKKFK